MLTAFSSVFRAHSFKQPVRASAEPEPVPKAQVLPAPKLKSGKPVLTSLDIDHTVIPWRKEPMLDEVAFQRYRKTLHHPEFRNNNFVMLNTGRGLVATKQIIPLLCELPVDALGLNDGQQLFLREEHATSSGQPKQSSGQWLRGLMGKQKDQDWKTHLGQWSTVKVIGDIRKTLPSLGFELASAPGEDTPHNTHMDYHVFTKPVHPARPEQGLWVVQVRPDQAFFEVSRSDKNASQQEIAGYSELLGSLLQESLRKKWPTIQIYSNSSPQWSNVHFGPEGIHKATLLDYLVGTRFENKPLAVISAGDSTNDTALLSRRHIAGDVPNYPIFVGKNRRVEAALSGKNLPNLERVAWNELDIGIQKQFDKIKAHLALKESEKGGKHKLDQTG